MDTENKVDRGVLSPKHNLDEALAMLSVLDKQFGSRPTGRDNIAESLGNKATSSAAGVKIGSLLHYGLLRKAGTNAYMISPLGVQLLRPKSDQERREGLLAAAKSPALYKKLFTEFEGKGLPGMFENILERDFGVARANTGEVAKNFRATAELVGLLVNGVIASMPADPVMPVSTPGTADAMPATQAATPKSVPPAESTPAMPVANSYSVPLTKGRTATLMLPRPLDAGDLNRIKSWIDLMADVLTEKEEPSAAQ